MIESAGISSDVPTTSLSGSDNRLFSRSEWNEIARSFKLSRREAQIVPLVFSDQSETEIAGQLGISTHTVHTYLERLYRKLDVSSRVQLVTRIFVQHRILNG